MVDRSMVQSQYERERGGEGETDRVYFLTTYKTYQFSLAIHHAVNNFFHILRFLLHSTSLIGQFVIFLSTSLHLALHLHSIAKVFLSSPLLQLSVHSPLFLLIIPFSLPHSFFPPLSYILLLPYSFRISTTFLSTYTLSSFPLPFITILLRILHPS